MHASIVTSSSSPVMLSLVCLSSAFSLTNKSLLRLQPQKLAKKPTTMIISSSSPQPQTVTPAKKNQTVEHFFLVKMKQDYKDLETFIDALNSLKCLPGVLYLSSGYINAISSTSIEDFTIFLHSRHAKKEDLDAYMGHPLKLAMINTYAPYHQDYMIIDFVHEHEDPLNHPTTKGTALRTTFFKLKDGCGEAEKAKTLQVATEHLPAGSVEQITFGDSYTGKTYCPAFKGYQLGMLAVFTGGDILDNLLSPNEYAKQLQEKLEDTLVPSYGVMVVDYKVKDVYNGDRNTLLP